MKHIICVQEGRNSLNRCKVEFFLNDRETATKLFTHCNEILDNKELDNAIEVMYRIIRSDVDRYLQK